MSQNKQREDSGDEGQDPNYDPEAEVHDQNWKKIDLPEITAVTGEEEEEKMSTFRVKLYRYRNEWKERGIGELKFLKHKKSSYIRLLVRAEKTHKIIANHLLQKQGDLFCNLQPMNTSNNSWTWAAYDNSDDKPRNEKFCAKFTSKEDYEKFQEAFEKACHDNQKCIEEKKEAEKKEENKQQAQKQQPTGEVKKQ